MNLFSKPAMGIAFTVFFVFTSVVAVSQSKMIKEVFKLLPPHLVYEMTDLTKDSILAGKTYYPAENDSESILAINFGGSALVKDYMYISMSYETSQRASGMVELRAFEMEEEKLVIVSNSGGVEGVNYQQGDITAYLYRGDSRLIPYSERVFQDCSVDLFLKSGIPDSIRTVIINNSNLTYNLSSSNVSLSLNSSFLLNSQESREWMIGDKIEYAWTGNKFEAGPACFSDNECLN